VPPIDFGPARTFLPNQCTDLIYINISEVDFGAPFQFNSYGSVTDIRTGWSIDYDYPFGQTVSYDTASREAASREAELTSQNKILARSLETSERIINEKELARRKKSVASLRTVFVAVSTVSLCW